MKKNPWLKRLLLVLAALALIFAVREAAPRFLGAPLSPAASAQAEQKPFQTLKKGGSGAEVRKAQEALKSLGYYGGRTDGNFSRAFEEAVIAFQKDFGLTPDGKIDEETYLFLLSELPAASPSPAPSPVEKKPTAAPGRPTAAPAPSPAPTEEPFVVQYEDYSDKDHVAAYLHLFGELPPNYITKKEATELGWVNSWGNLWKVAPEMSIGGDYFGNYEGQLPTARGRKYYECDIDYDPLENGGRRNGKRIIYSNDGLIFYTEDHYNTFEEITFQ